MKAGIITLIACLAALSGGRALADCTGGCSFVGDYKSHQSGDWETAGNWCECDGDYWVDADVPPGASNAVIIVDGTTIYVDSEEYCDNLTIEPDAVLQIKAGGGDLTVGGALNMQTPGTGENPSKIEFTGTGTAGMLTFSSSVTAAQEIVVNGPGKIVADAVLTLSSTGVIKAASGNSEDLEISGDFENDGDVLIEEENFVVEFSNGGLRSGSSGTITVDASGAKALFDLDIAAMNVTNDNGSIELEQGTVDFDGDNSFSFEGTFHMTSLGVLDTEGLTSGTVSLCDNDCT